MSCVTYMKRIHEENKEMKIKNENYDKKERLYIYIYINLLRVFLTASIMDAGVH